MRKRHDFWLDDSNRDHKAVARVIKRLKNHSQFASVVRDGIMIVSELREGRADTLLKLYPWIADIGKPKPTPDTDELKRQIDDLKRLIVEQGGIAPPPPNYPAMKQIAGAGVKLAEPAFDDQDTIVLKRSTNTDASMNLLNSMLGLQQ